MTIYNITGACTDIQFIDVAPGIASFNHKNDEITVAALNVKPHETEEVYRDWCIPIHLDHISEINYWNDNSFKSQVMKPGMFNLCPQGAMEKVRARNDHKILLVTFGQTLIEKMTEHNNVYLKRLQQHAHYGLVDNSVLYLAMALRVDFEAGSPYGRLHSQSLALTLLNRIFAIVNASDSMNAGLGSLCSSRLKRVTEYIKANLKRNLSLVEISNIACLTPFHFSRQFKKTTHISPHQYVLKLKIEHAENLLVNTDWPIVDIAFELGFQSQSHFTTVFHRMVGVTPGKFRKKAVGSR